MKKLWINKWKWAIKDPSLLLSWFNDFPKYSKKNQIKSSDTRTVFKLEINGGMYYVKFSHPKTFFYIFREKFFTNKAKSEYKSGMLLKELGMPVVDMVGWGKSGSRNMLISQEAKNAICARDYWFNSASKASREREKFLSSLAQFMKKSYLLGIVHPDLHLGNLLIRFSNEIPNFIFVDPYGVTVKKNTSIKKSGIYMLLGHLLKLSISEKYKFVIEAGLVDNNKGAKELWSKVEKKSIKTHNHKWRKRKKKVLKGHYSRYCSKVKDDSNNTWYIRNTSVERRPIIPAELVNHMDELEKKFLTRKLDAKQAKKIFLFSVFLQTQLIPHNGPIAWGTGKDPQKDIFIYEKNTQKTIIEQSTEIHHLVEYCKRVGIRISNPNNQICLINNEPTLKLEEPDASGISFPAIGNQK